MNCKNLSQIIRGFHIHQISDLHVQRYTNNFRNQWRECHLYQLIIIYAATNWEATEIFWNHLATIGSNLTYFNEEVLKVRAQSQKHRSENDCPYSSQTHYNKAENTTIENMICTLYVCKPHMKYVQLFTCSHKSHHLLQWENNLRWHRRNVLQVWHHVH